MNGNAWMVRVGAGAFLLLVGWLSSSVVEIKANRFTADDGMALAREDLAIWKALYQEQAFKQEILTRLTRIEERLP